MKLEIVELLYNKIFAVSRSLISFTKYTVNNCTFSVKIFTNFCLILFVVHDIDLCGILLELHFSSSPLWHWIFAVCNIYSQCLQYFCLKFGRWLIDNTYPHMKVWILGWRIFRLYIFGFFLKCPIIT